MLRLENEVIVLFRPEQRNDFVSLRILPEAMLDLPPKVGLPAAEIVVHINHGNAGFLGALFQPQKLVSHGSRIAQELVRLREIEVVDNVDQEQRDLRFIRSASVKIWIPGRHGKTRMLAIVGNCAAQSCPKPISEPSLGAARPSLPRGEKA